MKFKNRSTEKILHYAVKNLEYSELRVIVCFITDHPDWSASPGVLAERTGIHIRNIGKTIKSLVDKGWLISVRLERRKDVVSGKFTSFHSLEVGPLLEKLSNEDDGQIENNPVISTSKTSHNGYEKEASSHNGYDEPVISTSKTSHILEGINPTNITSLNNPTTNFSESELDRTWADKEIERRLSINISPSESPLPKKVPAMLDCLRGKNERSEILEIMSYKLSNYDTWFTERKAKEVMHLMLNELERAGMLPPAKIKRSVAEDEFTYENHEWEPEEK